MLDLAPPPAAAGRAPDEATRGGASGRERLLAAAAAQFAAKGYVATSVRDMGRVMAELKARYSGQMDFGAVGPMVKEKLL